MCIYIYNIAIGRLVKGSTTIYVILSLHRKTLDELAGTRLVLFSYGSGLASAMFSLKFDTDNSASSPLTALVYSATGLLSRLESRKCLTPAEFEATLALREEAHMKAPYTPKSSNKDLFPGTFYLTEVDDSHRRTYERSALPPEFQPKVAKQPIIAPVRLVDPVSNGIVNGH